MIRPIRDRRAFERLAADGTRIQRPALWCIWCPDPRSPAASAAFALGRTLGPAVVRNRSRRRLRAVLRQLDSAEPLPLVMMLIGSRRPLSELTYEKIERDVTAIVEHIRTHTPPAEPNAGSPA